MILKLTGISLLCLLLCSTAPAAGRTTVQVRIAEQNAGLRNKLESYAKRELRSLGDVDVVDNDLADFTLRYIFQDGSKFGNPAIYVVTLLYTERTANYVGKKLREKYPTTDLSAYLSVTDEVTSSKGTYVYTYTMPVDKKKPDEFFKSSITGFDSHFLERHRKASVK